MVIKFMQAIPIARLTIMMDEFKRYRRRLLKMIFNLMAERIDMHYNPPNPMPFFQTKDIQKDRKRKKEPVSKNLTKGV